MPRWKSKPRLNETTIEIPAVEIEKPVEKEYSIFQTSSNKIYFYSDVTRESIFNLNRQIDEVTKHLKCIQFNYGLPKPPPIELYLSTDGGDIFPALSTVDRIINNSIPIHTICEGIVASAGTLISVVGAKRFITKNSSMLVHQLHGSFWGNYMQVQDEIKNLDLIMKNIRKIYIKHTKFEEKELDEILKHDLYLEAEECKKFGLVDSIC